MALYALTPEWQKAAAKVYREDPTFKRAFGKVNGTPVMVIQANKSAGIEDDLYLLNTIENGVLLEDDFVSRKEGEERATWLLTATYDVWKEVYTGKKIFIEAFLGSEIKLIKGDFAGLMRIAAQGTKLADIFTRNKAVWPDELSGEELEKYKENHKKWTRKLES